MEISSRGSNQQATSHCLNEWWHSLLTHICVTRWFTVLGKGRVVSLSWILVSWLEIVLFVFLVMLITKLPCHDNVIKWKHFPVWYGGLKAHWSYLPYAWWRHQMETFSASMALCAGNSPVTGEFPSTKPVTRSFDIFFDLRPNKFAWVSNREAGDLRRHRAHYDIIVIDVCEHSVWLLLILVDSEDNPAYVLFSSDFIHYPYTPSYPLPHVQSNFIHCLHKTDTAGINVLSSK